MAKNKSTVYLGYEDEEITVKHLHSLHCNVNKVGGIPDWPSTDIKVTNCPLCGTARPLIVQLYAPLEQSQFHRTLYIFACLNPTCSQNSKSWLCIRTQHLDAVSQSGEIITGINSMVAGVGKKKKFAKQAVAAMQTQKISWCSGADDWGTALPNDSVAIEEMDTEADSAEVLNFDQQNEENGNVIETNDNSPTRLGGASVAAAIRVSEDEDDDEDEESNSMENDLICGFGHLEMHPAQNASGEDPNANCAGGVAALAVGGGSAIAGAAAATTVYAEIEGGESDVVFVETPKKPERDLIALLKHTPTSVALGPLAKVTDVTVKPFFISVDIEMKQRPLDEYEHYGGTLSADHIRELYQEYKRQDENALSPNLSALGGIGNGSGVAEGQEIYEKALPAHGDVIFHQFVSTIQQNPGQILRYSRDTLPLLTAPLTEPIPKCQNCNGETICEVQILPTLIPKLRLQQNSEAAPIEFGNVLTFTCLKSCWDTPDKMRYEKIIVQAEN